MVIIYICRLKLALIKIPCKIFPGNVYLHNIYKIISDHHAGCSPGYSSLIQTQTSVRSKDMKCLSQIDENTH